MCEIAMLIFGIITLIRGRFLLTRAKEVRGWKARFIGLLLVMPFPLSFLIGMVLGAIFLSTGKDVEGQDFRSAAFIAEFSIVAVCFIAAIGVATVFAEPIRKKRSEHEDVAIPDDYDERFQARSRDITGNQDITGGTSPPTTPPDDRIQG